MVMQQKKQLLMPHNLFLPLLPVHSLQLIERSPRKIQALPINVLKMRSPPNLRLFPQSTPPHPFGPSSHETPAATPKDSAASSTNAGNNPPCCTRRTAASP